MRKILLLALSTLLLFGEKSQATILKRLIVSESKVEPTLTGQILPGGRATLNLTTNRFGQVGSALGSAYDTAFADAYQVVPTYGSFKNLRVYLPKAAPGAGNSWTFTLYKKCFGCASEAATSLAVTVSGTNTSAVDLNNIVSVEPRDAVALFISSSGSPTTTSAVWTLEWAPRLKGENILLGMTNSAGFVNNGDDMHVAGNNSPSDDLLDTSEQIIPCNGTFKKFYFALESAPGAGKSWTLTFRKNNVDQALKVIIDESATDGYDLTNTVRVNAGDTVSIGMTSAGGAAEVTGYWGMVFEPDDPRDFVLLFSNPSGSALSNWTVGHSIVNGLIQVTDDVAAGFTTAIQGRQQLAAPMSIKSIYVTAGTAPGVGNSFTFDLQSNGSDIGLQAVMSDTEQTASKVLSDNSLIYVPAGALLSTEITSASTFTDPVLWKISYCARINKQ